MSLAVWKEWVCHGVDRWGFEADAVSQALYENPEPGYAEYQSSRLAAEFLRRHGFQVQLGAGGLPTALWAERVTSGWCQAHTVAILLEYDALPGVGHGCGHNAITAASLNAAAALGELLDEVPGRLLVIGTPAEEGTVEGAGGKILLLESGLFAGVGLALLAHPADKYVAACNGVAREALEVTFRGRFGHGTTDSGQAVNAQTPLLNLFWNLEGSGNKLPGGTAVNGVITAGAVAPGIVPDHSRARFYLRDPGDRHLDEAVKRFKGLVRRTARRFGAGVEVRTYARRYLCFHNHAALLEAIEANFRLLKVSPERWPENSRPGSTDMGNLSQVIPSAHMYFRIADAPLPAHTPQFAQASVSEAGRLGVRRAAKALAMTALDYFATPALRAALSRPHTNGGVES